MQSLSSSSPIDQGGNDDFDRRRMSEATDGFRLSSLLMLFLLTVASAAVEALALFATRGAFDDRPPNAAVVDLFLPREPPLRI